MLAAIKRTANAVKIEEKENDINILLSRKKFVKKGLDAAPNPPKAEIADTYIDFSLFWRISPFEISIGCKTEIAKPAIELEINTDMTDLEKTKILTNMKEIREHASKILFLLCLPIKEPKVILPANLLAQ